MAEPGVVRPDGADPQIEPLFYPSNRLDFSAPLRWLRLGWHDLNRARAQSLTYGTGLAVFAFVVAALVWSGGNVVALFSLGMAFILAGPVLAFGLYSISRQLELGREPRLGVCWSESRNHLRNELLFALVMLVVLLVWARAASMVHVFFPIGEDLGVVGWLEFLAVGSAVGSIFAAIVFSSSVVALPMMLDRGTDAITSALTSIGAVLNNKGVMLLWALMILALVLVGFATAFIGLVVVLPLIGHASWHAYRETVKVPD
ncbi:MAG: DUF2189 domain-containing protein [Chromatiaceae bacterium]|nr:DUF2189 domain-containing protein [Gammaproteobacteria bacterium]MCP5313211.1 DUF2189 domain-containing protein [Chromatiaceae bacterium]